MNKNKAEELITKILKEEIKIYPRGNKLPQQIYAGDVYYNVVGKNSNYGIVVFNDCNQIDYIDSVVSADFTFKVFDFGVSQTFSFEKIIQSMSEDEIWKIFRIPGYLKFRCETCGIVLNSQKIDADNANTLLCEKHIKQL